MYDFMNRSSRMSSIIQIRRKILCGPAPARLFWHICFCLFCPADNGHAFCIREPAVDDLLEVLLVFDTGLIHVFRNGIDGYLLHRFPLTIPVP